MANIYRRRITKKLEGLTGEEYAARRAELIADVPEYWRDDVAALVPEEA